MGTWSQRRKRGGGGLPGVTGLRPPDPGDWSLADDPADSGVFASFTAVLPDGADGVQCRATQLGSGFFDLGSINPDSSLVANLTGYEAGTARGVLRFMLGADPASEYSAPQDVATAG